MYFFSTVKMNLVLLIGVLFIAKNGYCDSRLDPLVRIDQGLVRGQKDVLNQYAYFLGIPYAKVNSDNPFGAPGPAPNFGDDIFNAYDGSVACPQVSTQSARSHALNRQEDINCLKLNIYVPYEASTQNPSPVLVWIHGGEFNSGQASEVDPRNLVKKGIIVVTINYRLGPYGFLCLDSPNVPGNQGLKDQFEALRWVRANIASFGGNPYEVTIGGHDAGACAALLHLYSPRDKLFKRVIAESGTPITDGLFVEGDLDAAIKLAEYLGFNATDTEQALNFLINSSPALVTGAAKDLDLVLRPCVERSFSGIDSFVETFPYSLTNRRKVKGTSVLIGHTSLESNVLDKDYIKTDPFYRKIKNNFYLSEEQIEEAANSVRQYYIGDKTITEDLLPKLKIFDSDYVYNYPTQRTISNMIEEEANPVYEYLFSYEEESDEAGAGHAAELPYLFGLSFADEEGKLLSERLAILWTNFVKYGNPTPENTELLAVTWEPVTSETRWYLNIDRDIFLDSRVFQDRMSFWNLFYSLYGKSHVLTRECSVHRQKDIINSYDDLEIMKYSKTMILRR